MVSFPLTMVSFKDAPPPFFLHFPLRHPDSPKALLSPLLFSRLTFPGGPPTSLASIPTNASDAPSSHPGQTSGLSLLLCKPAHRVEPRECSAHPQIVLHRWLSGEEPACQCRRDSKDLGSIRGSGRSSGEGNDNQFQYFCLENFMDRGAWRATVHEVAESRI